MKSLYGDRSRLTPEIHRHYLEPLREPAERRGCWTFPRQIIGSSEWLKGLWEKRAALEGNAILLAWGMKDIAFREKELSTWSESFPKARVIPYEDAGHFVAEEKPDELAGEISAIIGD